MKKFHQNSLPQKLQLFGMYVVKLALAVVLAGGVPKTNNTGKKKELPEFHKII